MTTRLTQPKIRDRSQPENVGLPVGPSARPGKLYVYVHYGSGWYWSSKIVPGSDGVRYGWLPRPQCAMAHPGVNGVRDPGKGKPMTREHMSAMIGGLLSKGAKIIEPEDARLGPYQFYDQYYDTQDGGRWYIEPGQEFVVLPNGTVMSNADDVGPFVLEMHRYLRDEAPDLVHPLLREVYLSMMAMERDRLSRREQAAGVTPGLGYRVDAQIARIEAMEEDWARYEESLAARASAPPPVQSSKPLRVKRATRAEEAEP